MTAQIDIVIPSRGPSPQRSALLQDLDRELVGREDVCTISIEEGPSAARNRNRAAREQSAPWIAFLDDDIRLPPGWLDSVLQVTQLPDPPDIFSGTIGSTHPRNIFSMAAEDFVVRHKQYGDSWFLAGAMMVMNRDAFNILNGFDESFSGAGGEDWRLCVMAHSAGMRIQVVPNLSCRHENPRSMRDLMSRARSYSATESPPSTHSSNDLSQSPSVGVNSPLPMRILRWPVREYRELRSRGRSRGRALASTVLYIPWMTSYLINARRSAKR